MPAKRKSLYIGLCLLVFFVSNGHAQSSLVDVNLYKVVHLDSAINSASNDYLPVLSLDEQTLYFCSTRSGGIGNEDIWYSKKVNGKWTAAKNIGAPLNTPSNEALLSTAPDGKTVYLFGNYAGSKSGGDIFISTLTDSGWSPPKNVGSPISSKYWDVDAYITNDGKYLFFTSTRPADSSAAGGSNADIFVSVKHDSIWGEPINLGPTINTPLIDRHPFFHPDGKTLYFCSQGHNSMGGFDVFKSTKLSDSWTDWSAPENIGSPINSKDDDLFYSISTQGDYIYFSARRPDSYGGFDLYSIPLPKKAKPKPVFTLKGRITDSDGNPLHAKIVLEDLDTGDTLAVINDDPETGKYFTVLPAEKKVAYTVMSRNHLFKSDHIDTGKLKESKEKDLNIELQPIQKKKEIVLNNIFFDFNSADLRSESIIELKKVVQIMRENPKLVVEIQGYTDNVGTDEYNLKLSENRAQSVADYLIEQGIESDRLKVIGYGEAKPVASNATEEGRQKNRRVVFKILSVD